MLRLVPASLLHRLLLALLLLLLLRAVQKLHHTIMNQHSRLSSCTRLGRSLPLARANLVRLSRLGAAISLLLLLLRLSAVLRLLLLALFQLLPLASFCPSSLLLHIILPLMLPSLCCDSLLFALCLMRLWLTLLLLTLLLLLLWCRKLLPLTLRCGCAPGPCLACCRLLRLHCRRRIDRSEAGQARSRLGFS
jgi:hypothetical protein